MLVNETKNRTCAASQPSDQRTTHSDEIAISVKNLTKKYRIFGHPGDRIKQALTFGRVRFHREFTALQDVSFEIKKGETVGIIGRNGSGKSTLLQLICGILKPTSGTVEVNGRVSALLELGAGFNPEFTGRENVYFQGAVMGIIKDEMVARFDEIAAFADIGEFIDQPVRTYSSGMFVRLAFAVAIHVEPEILVIDEALAVGDYAFQSKCMNVLRKFREQGGTILLVSHDINTVKALCDRGVCLKKDGGCQVGSADVVSEEYLRDMRSGMRGRDAVVELTGVESSSGNNGPFRVNADFARKVEAFRQGTGEARVTAVELLDEAGLPLVEAEFGQRAIVRLHIQFDAPCEVLAAYYMRDDKHMLLVGSSTLQEGIGLLYGVSGDRKIVEFVTELPLKDGPYNILTQLSTPIIPNVSSQIVDYVEDAVLFTVRERYPTKLWSKVYLKNSVSVTGVDRA
ncbi:MAG: ABC transporter ATP-binding protein [Sulfuricella sp.]